MTTPPRQATSHSQMVELLNGRDPNDPLVKAYADQSRQVLRSTPHGKLASDIIDTLTPTLGEMERRLRQLEARPIPKWAGPFREGEAYAALSFAVHQGGLWVSRCSTGDRPGTSDHWTLVCKKGSHDGR